MLKICSNCKNYKDTDEEFYKSKASKDGYYAYCKFCSNLKTTKFQKETYPFRKEKLKNYQDKYRKKLLDQNPLYFKQQQSAGNLNRRKEVIKGYGGKCTCCGESNYEFLAIDHVYNDGKEDRKYRSCQQLLRYIIKNKYPVQYQILCHNCNLSKAFHGYCPHKIN